MKFKYITLFQPDFWTVTEQDLITLIEFTIAEVNDKGIMPITECFDPMNPTVPAINAAAVEEAQWINMFTTTDRGVMSWENLDWEFSKINDFASILITSVNYTSPDGDCWTLNLGDRYYITLRPKGKGAELYFSGAPGQSYSRRFTNEELYNILADNAEITEVVK